MNEQKKTTNRLIKEKSPYLLQHAYNPVDWYPWGEEAFFAAKELDKPIFLSIGYSTCHWCHVMEHESFENQEVSDLMNSHFINIKVDREERPDIDSLYMGFAQSLMAGSGGWPLNIFLTPDLHPFFSSTYLPPYTTNRLLGMCDLIERIHQVWISDEREELLEQADLIVTAMSEHLHVKGDSIPSKDQIENTTEVLFQLADPSYGGFRGLPKFPVGYQWTFLMHDSISSKDGRSLFLAERTLDMMHRGGIYDHLGGGFSRYSVDEHWLVPHFEKMLYDNALLAHCYLEAWLITRHERHRLVCIETLNYILRDMTHPEGGFYSAEDADSEGKEGYFYTWSYDEVHHILGSSENTTYFCNYYNITPEGNFEGRNILNTPEDLEFFAKNIQKPQEFCHLFKNERNLLWNEREKRIHPFKDDKILSSWNGLMIFSMASAGSALNHKPFIDAAVKSAKFIKKNMYNGSVLQRRFRLGESLYHGCLEDYAYLIRGLLTLFEIGQGSEWLEWAIEMTTSLQKSFKAEGGAFYQTDGHDSELIMRQCLFQDSAEPSGNAIHCENLLRLYQLTNQQIYITQAEDILKAAQIHIDAYPPGYCYHMLNLMRYYDSQATTLVIALGKDASIREVLEHPKIQGFELHRAIIWVIEGDECLIRCIPDIKNQISINGQTTVYPCQQGSCKEFFILSASK